MHKIGFVLVLLMALLQGFYGIYAILDPIAFASLRGTELFAEMDVDWVRIYGSRTLFVALVVGFLLYCKHYRFLLVVALFGTVMPIADAWLAYNAGAETAVVAKHVATIVYLLLTAQVLSRCASNKESDRKTAQCQ